MSRAKLFIIFSLVLGIFCFASPAHAANTSLFSLSVSVKPVTSIASKAIVGKAEEMRMATNASGYPLCQIKSGAAWQTAVTSSQAISVGEWSKIVCTYDLISFKIYVNGVLKGTQALTAVADDTSAVWKIGKDDSASTSYGMFTGLVDDYQFYNFPLSADDVEKDYNSGMSAQMGSSGTTSAGAPTNADSRDYCVPGDTATCNPPVGEWNFNEKVKGDAKTLYDTSGNGNNGTSNDGANNTGMDCSVPGKVGTACRFDGVDDEVYTGNFSVGSANFTISSWIYPEDDDIRDFLYQYAGSGEAWFIRRSSSKLAWYNDNGGGWLVGSKLLDKQKWNYITVTYNGSTLRLYVNGQLDVSRDQSVGISSNSSTISIGKSYYPTYFNGLIDQVRIYNYARTPAQIAWEYNQGKPIAEWRMNECSGTTIHDESGNNNTGTLTLGASGQTAAGTCSASASTPWYSGRTGKYGASLNFDGQDDYVDLDSKVANVEGLNQGTLAGWFKTSSTAAQAIFSLSDVSANTDYMAVLLNNVSGAFTDESICFVVARGGSSLQSLFVREGDGVYSDGQWHYFAVATGNGASKIYIDGKERGFTGNATILEFSNINNPSAMRIGNRRISNINVNHFAGQIDDVKIFNYALTSEQVRNLYNNSSAVQFSE